MNAVKKVLVVGGGIGGQSVAIGLRRAGIDVEIAEILPEFNVYGVGIIQQQNALRALDDLGIGEEALRRGSPYGQVKMFTAGGHPVGLAGAPANEKYPSHNGISRRVLHEVMFEEASKLGVTFRMGLTVKNLENREDGVSVTFTDGSEGEYDMLIASDGINSKVRGMVFEDLQPRYVGLSVWRYPFKRHEDLDTGYIYYGRRSKIGFIPMNEESMYMFLVSAEGVDPSIPEEQLVPKLVDYMSEYPVKIAQDAIKEVTQAELVNYRPLEALRLPDPWYKNRVVIIGDAAHATIPQLGSGAALAIEDAVVLADELQMNPEVNIALEAFMKRRYDRCMMVVNASETLGEWELLEFQGKPLPEGANPGALIGRTVGALGAPI
ncbi:FAD-dependent monooxygenase [Jiulongibacter sediminis]|jgi:2-polyprenyl-6-methoxyphenol hydroxylase-like FAD-dependent oxidoreductase|uniref:FAD-dependent monooxygenase n=1 Tax=Jiulongibacter sediminis TaxID=1605367 RepID=UPI0026ED0F8A|nr:FAD-dependent monooxygenase [Jiulongibacter sediminis]